MTGSERAQAVVAYRARFDECGPDATLRAAALLRWAQDVAWIHSEREGFTREWYAERDLAWVVRGLHLAVLAPVQMGATVQVSTRVGGFRRVMARRRTEMVLADGTLAALALTDWVMTDAARGVPTRVPADLPGRFDAPAGGFDPIRVDPPSAPDGLRPGHLAVRPQDLDPMAHANNAVYVDWLEEAVQAAGGQPVLAAIPRTYRLEYLASAAPAQELRTATWTTDQGRTWHHVLSAAAGGNDLLRASLQIGAEP